ncbi:Niemann-Pick C type protein [Trema orientale]|uniref:Niemann-Pick C type protein n=1 Tax=Trema orientale TaxID=63057 RepID=A0A2P5DYY2_TREOI|nr:Niemann-Pick C type protein [Trema orientale]
MTLGEQNTLAESYGLLDQAFNAGINFFDSAEMYPVPQRVQTQGRSEEYLGRWIRNRKISRDHIVLATKVAGPSGQMTWIRGGPKCLDARNIREAIDNSLLRLQTDYIDLYQIHWPDRYVPMFGETEYDPTRQFCSISIEEQLDALGRAIADGKIRYVGLSNETPYGVMKFLQAAQRDLCLPKIISVQNSYNLLCRTFDFGVAECCHHERIPLLAYSPLAMGILSGKYFLPDGGPGDARMNMFRGKYSEGESRYNLSNKIIKAATMEYLDIARRLGLNPVSLAIAFVLRHPLVASVVFGATKSWQLQEILNGCQVELTSEIVKEINEVHARLLSSHQYSCPKVEMVSFSASAFLRPIYLLQVVFITYLLSAEKSVKSQALPISDVTFGDKHSKEYCAMYDICGERSDGKVLNCPYGSSSVKPDELFSAKIQSLCPTLSGNVCCTEAQFDTLRTQVQQAIPFLVGCPACLRNFLNLFCELSCSPNQSQFINVTSTSQVNGNLTVDGIDYFISDSFGEGLFNSCKDVKFGTMNTRAIEFIGAGAKNFKEWFAFIGQKAPPGFPGSPYSINFKSSVSEASGMDPMNVSVYSCADTSLGCSCGDCLLSPACSNFEPPSPSKEDACSIKIGPLKVRCIELSVAILYILLVSAVLGWGFSHRMRERRTPSSSVEPLLNVLHDETDSGKGDEKVPRVTDGIQLSAVQHYLSNFFRAYGAWVARNPYLVLCSSLAIVVVLCLGLVCFNVETRPEKMKQCPVFHGGLIMYKTSQLWVGPGSRAAEEKQFFDSHLAPFYRIEQVDGIRANHSGLMVSLTDICMKPLGQDCATQSILQYFKMDPENYDMYGGVEHAEYCFQHYSSADTCLSAFKAPLDPSTALGGFPGNNYSEASAFVVTYPVNNAVDKVGGENGRALAWEKAFIKLAKEELLPLVHSSNLTLSFSSESSIEEELKRESTADVITIVISYLVMFAYISVTLGDASRLSSFYLSSKVLLGLSGVVLVLLSVLGSVGLFSALGVKSTLIIMEVIPFLVLAVGVDNMCILVHAVKRQSLELPLEQRISNALVEVGPSITLASLSEILAFAVGSFISMPACRVFSMFAALAVLLDFFLQVTAFVALIVFDFSRAEDNRIDCFPCIKIPSSSMDPSEGSSHGRTGLLTRYMEEVHAPILGIWAVKMVVIAVFLAFTLASIALSTRIEPGLEQQIVLPRDSYLQGYFNNISEYLRVGPPLYFVVKNFNYSSQSRQTNKLCSISGCDSNSLLNEISRASLTPESSYIAKPAASWLDDFLVWMSPEAFGCCRKFINGSYCPPDDQPPCCTPDESPCGLGGVCKDCTTCFRHSDLVNDRPSTVQFMEKLPWFLNALPSADCAKGGHGAYTNSVDLNGYESGIIQASEFRTYHTPVNKQVDYVNSLRAAREFSSRISASLKMPVFPYSVFYIFFEQYLDIWRIALTDIALALGAIFIVCLLITSSLWSSLIILLILAMIVVDLMGVMAILDIQLNAVSVVNLIMSIGIAVEFCVHIMHAYLVSHGDRNHRMKEALRTMGASVFSGITLTKLVGVIVLCFARSEIFVVYYFQMYLALVLIGFLHGLVFLPVVLSLFGPTTRRAIIEN